MADGVSSVLRVRWSGFRLEPPELLLQRGYFLECFALFKLSLPQLVGQQELILLQSHPLPSLHSYLFLQVCDVVTQFAQLDAGVVRPQYLPCLHQHLL